MKPIKRNLFAQGVQLRETTEGDSRIIEGYAIVFDAPSETLYIDSRGRRVREVISPSAVCRELLDASDIKMTMFHDRQLILARSNKGSGTLSYEIDDIGVHFTFEAPRTADGDKAVELVKRGDISGCSFAFSIDYEDPTAITIKRSEEELTVVINKIAEVYDFTLAADPAYTDTSVSLRELIDSTEENTTEENTTPADTTASQEETDSPEQQATDNSNTNITTDEMTPISDITPREDTRKSFTQIVREVLPTITNGAREFILREDGTPTTPTVTDPTILTGNANTAGIIPIRVKDILDPVSGGIVYDKIGVPISHNNSGQFLWPVYGAAEASFLGENEPIVPQTIDMSKITAKPERLAISFQVSRMALEQTDGVMEDIVMRSLTQAVRTAINALILSTSAPTGAPTGVAGPLVAASATSKVVSLSATPTYKQLGQLKGKLYASGIDGLTPVAVMSPLTRCTLEVTSRDTGSGRMMIEDGKLLGMPVYETNAIGDSYIAFGDYRFQPLGFFGKMSLLIDPFSLSLKGAVRFVLDLGVATATLRPEAFVVGKMSAS